MIILCLRATVVSNVLAKKAWDRDLEYSAHFSSPLPVHLRVVPGSPVKVTLHCKLKNKQGIGLRAKARDDIISVVHGELTSSYGLAEPGRDTCDYEVWSIC